jgi:cyanuric acid amidohydrolase
MRPNSFNVIRIPTSGPGDVSGLMALVDSGALDPSFILAVLGKTEGNGGVNDFTREYAVSALCNALSSHLKLAPCDVEARIAFVMSGGTEGVLSPHITVFTRSRAPERVGANPNEKRLSFGIAHTRDFLPEEIGRDAQIEETTKAVEAAMRDASIAAVSDVHFVQIKCPLLTSERVQDAAARGKTVVTASGYASMSYSRGASAIGVAKALGEVGAEVGERQVLKDWTLYSSVASCSAGIELMHNVVILIGNSRFSSSPFQIGHAVMRDAIDLSAVIQGARERGIERDRHAIAKSARQRSRQGRSFSRRGIRGLRHTMLEDSDIIATRHARAAVGGLIGGVSGTGAVYVSGGAEHQGPAGGGPIAVIARI